MTYSNVAFYACIGGVVACVLTLYVSSRLQARRDRRENAAWARDHGQYADWRRTGAPTRRNATTGR